MFAVIVTEKGGSQQRLEFEKESISIGRIHGNDVVLPRGNVSKYHSLLEYKNGTFMLTDMGSTNGTYVNGRRIPDSHPILEGDKIYVGDFILHVDQGSSALEERAPSVPPGPGISVATGEQAPPVVVSQKSDIVAPISPKKPRKSKAPQRSRTSDGPSEKRVPLPRPTSRSDSDGPTARPSVKPSLPSPIAAATGDGIDLPSFIEKTIKKVSKKFQLLTGATLPALVDPKTAGQIRQEIHGLIDWEVAAGAVPAGIPPRTLKAMIYRTAVYLGPLGAWLADSNVERIRVFGHNAISHFRGGEWVDIDEGFVSQEDLSQIILCLASGLKTEDGGLTGVRRFRLEEGYFVYTALSHDRTFLVVDKTVTKGLTEGTEGLLDNAGKAVISDAINSRARIAVVGPSNVARRQMYYQLLSLLPTEELTVSLEDLPLDISLGPKCLRLPLPKTSDAGHRLRDALFNALTLEPAWLTMSGATWRDIPDILNVAVGRPGVIADLPVNGVKEMDRELGVILACGGTSLTPATAAFVLKESFDLIVVVHRSKDGKARLKHILSVDLDANGLWSPHLLYGK